MRLDERWSPGPDLMVIRDEHRQRMTPTRLEGPADWVIEIVFGKRVSERSGSLTRLLVRSVWRLGPPWAIS